MTSGQVSPRSWQSWSSCCAYTLYTAASVSGNSQNASCLSWNLVTCRHAPPDLPVPEGLPTSLSALHPSLSVALLDLHAPGLLPRHLRSSLLTLPPQYPCCKEESKGREKGQNKILDATVQQMLVTSPFLQLGYWTTFESLKHNASVLAKIPDFPYLMKLRFGVHPRKQIQLAAKDYGPYSVCEFLFLSTISKYLQKAT